MSSSIAQLPSLDLIRGFVAVGRRMSITLAADDLFVTQSAVSRQIRSLEDMLGVKLLHRGHRSIRFTPEGDRLFQVASGAMQSLQDAIGALRMAGARPPVTITCTIGVAALWLLPRLNDFQRAHPGIDIRIAASDRIEDLTGDSIDIAIRYCSREKAADGAQRLFGESVTPVASPSLGLASLDEPATLARYVLLEFDGSHLPWLHWREWLTTQGMAEAKPKSTLRFNQYDQVISAAIAGQGLALGRLPMLTPLIDDGRLQIVGAPRAGPLTTYAYWLVNASAKPRPDVVIAAEWIREQAAGLDGNRETR
jgi:LysR family transcriptional regulator, glycine cleavage system transcriptional activator